jgi:lipoprotein-releasing system ATP-binding protein
LGELDDESLAEYRNHFVGFVFQFHFLLPSMTCEDNIYLPGRIAGADLSPIGKEMKVLAKELGVSHCLSKYPFQLSGGEQQRINIIRALSLRPKLLLCDEPTGSLDTKNSNIVIKILKELSQEFAATLIVVTHNEKLASEFPNRIFIEDGKSTSSF